MNGNDLFHDLCYNVQGDGSGSQPYADVFMNWLARNVPPAGGKVTVESQTMGLQFEVEHIPGGWFSWKLIDTASDMMVVDGANNVRSFSDIRAKLPRAVGLAYYLDTK